MPSRMWLGACIGLSVAACIDREPFACEQDEQCRGLDRPGRCEAPGFCAHPDDDCESGWAFGRFASPELAGRCTEPAQASSTGPEDSTSSSEGASSSEDSSSQGGSSSGDPVPVEICDGIDNDGDRLTDEWSEVNEQCNGCDLFQREGRAYWSCAAGRWTDLQPICEGFGANLASIHDPEENLFLALRLESGANWIGINDIGNEGVYTWVDGAPLDYTNWVGGAEPAPNPEDNCGGIDTQGEWHIFNCTNGRPGFCEAPHPD